MLDTMHVCHLGKPETDKSKERKNRDRDVYGYFVRVQVQPGSYVTARLTWDRPSAYNVVVFG
jgi:hypothetical protein